ncbi:MAG: transporter, family, cyanate transporter, partial [Chloroflexota bacterium]|nr:transporter, family, cyanate transporter [Chloroflexota bacterium]
MAVEYPLTRAHKPEFRPLARLTSNGALYYHSRQALRGPALTPPSGCRFARGCAAAENGGGQRRRGAAVPKREARAAAAGRRRPSLAIVAALVGIVVAAFNLRIAVVSVGPLLEEIRADTGMSSALAGVLTTIPFVCMGAFSVSGAPVVRLIGRERAVAAGLMLIVVGTLLRSAVSSPAMLLAATVPSGIGIAIMNVTLPAVVRDRFPH